MSVTGIGKESIEMLGIDVAALTMSMLPARLLLKLPLRVVPLRGSDKWSAVRESVNNDANKYEKWSSQCCVGGNDEAALFLTALPAFQLPVVRSRVGAMPNILGNMGCWGPWCAGQYGMLVIMMPHHLPID